MDTVTLSSKGQLVIPKSIRDHAKVSEGARLEVRYVDGEIRLRPIEPLGSSTIDQVAGCLARPGRKRMSESQTDAAIRERLRSRNAP